MTSRFPNPIRQLLIASLAVAAVCARANGDTPSAAASSSPITPPASVPVAPPVAAPAPEVGVYGQSVVAMAFADDLAQRRGLDAQWVRQQIGAARRQPSVIRFSILQRAATENWTPTAPIRRAVRIRAGLRFWEAHRDTLARAEREYGVPASLIVGVIGIETIYGQHTGNYRVIDALATLAFDFPASHPRAEARSEFFRSELEQFLNLTHRTGLDPLAVRGSYAGAARLAAVHAQQLGALRH